MKEPVVSMFASQIKDKQALREKLERDINTNVAGTRYPPKIQVIEFGVSKRILEQQKKGPMTAKENTQRSKKSIHAMAMSELSKRKRA